MGPHREGGRGVGRDHAMGEREGFIRMQKKNDKLIFCLWHVKYQNREFFFRRRFLGSGGLEEECLGFCELVNKNV